MNKVFILEHTYEIDDRDETKFIGVYSSKTLAESAINRLKNQPGFKDRQDCFVISKIELDKDNWTEGFVTLTNIHVKNKENSWVSVQAQLISDLTYQIIELSNNNLLGEFKYLDVVRCEERENKELYALELITKAAFSSFDHDFCAFLEFHLCKTFKNSNDLYIQAFWCDGINNEQITKSEEFINKWRQIETTAWIGKDGQDKYDMTIKLGNDSFNKYSIGLDLTDCVPSEDSMNWIEINTDKKTIELQLK
jgi:hypothetical protein